MFNNTLFIWLNKNIFLNKKGIKIICPDNGPIVIINAYLYKSLDDLTNIKINNTDKILTTKDLVTVISNLSIPEKNQL